MIKKVKPNYNGAPFRKYDKKTKKFTHGGIKEKPGEFNETTIERFVRTGQMQESIMPPIYGDEVIPGCDIRTDRWEIANDMVISWNEKQTAAKAAEATPKVEEAGHTEPPKE